MGNYVVNGNRVEDKTVRQVLEQLATSTDVRVRNLLTDRKIASAAEANRLVNVSSSNDGSLDEINNSDLERLNRGLGRRPLTAHQFGTLAHYLQRQFGSANSGESIPVVNPRLFEKMPNPEVPEEFRKMGFSVVPTNGVPTLRAPFGPDDLPIVFLASPTDRALEDRFGIVPRFTRIMTTVNGTKATLSIETNYGGRGVYELDKSGGQGTYAEYAQGRLVEQQTFSYKAPAPATVPGVGRERVSGAPGGPPPPTDAVAAALKSVVPAEGGENHVVSSYSVLDALLLLLGGLTETQYQEVAKRLGLHPDVRQQLAEAKALRDSLRSTPDVTLTVANRVYAIPNSLQPDYVRTLEQFFESQGHADIDFRTNSEQARRTINRWVGQQTNGLIPELLVSGDINQDTAFVLVNALYFKGKWTHPFDRSDTRDGDFTRANGTVVKTPMMSQTDSFAFRETDDYKVVALPYGQNEAMSMIVVLPEEGSRWQPDEAFYRNAGGQMSDERIYLQLPRFTVRNRVKLSQALGAMGLSDLDYSRMIRGPIDRLEAVTQIVLEVNEEGAKGAAATAAYATRGMTPTFRANRPFYFAVVHHETGTILFSGQVADPSEGSR